MFVLYQPGVSNSFYIMGRIQTTLILSGLNQWNSPFYQCEKGTHFTVFLSDKQNAATKKAICQHSSLDLNSKKSMYKIHCLAKISILESEKQT